MTGAVLQDVVIDEAWYHNPIVRNVLGRFTDPPSAFAVFDALSSMLNELEEKFPGLSFNEILYGQSETASKRDRIRATLSAAGVAAEDIDLVAPSQFSMAASGLSETELEREYGVSASTASEIVKLRQPPSDRERQIAALVDAGQKPAHVAKALGVSRSTVKRAMERVAYEAMMNDEHACEVPA